MMSASGELKMGSEEGVENIMAVGVSKIVLGRGGQGPFVHFNQA